MAYHVKDQNGYLSHGPSINGLREIKKLLKQQPPHSFPAIEDFINNGVTDYTTEVAGEFRELKLKAIKTGTIEALNHLAQQASRAKGFFSLGA